MTIRPIKVIRSTKDAWMLEWFDYNFRGKVKAWVPKSKVKIQHYTAYMDMHTYNNLKIIPNAKPKNNKKTGQHSTNG